MSVPTDKKQEPKGTPYLLAACIRHLGLLLRHLPNSLPIKEAELVYSFGLDHDDIKDEGVGYALNRNLEVTFRTFENPVIIFNQRGSCFDNLLAMLRHAAKKLPAQERDAPNGHLRRWMECLISAAELTGAKIPTQHTRSLSDDEDVSPLPASSPAVDLVSNCKSDIEIIETTAPVLRSDIRVASSTFPKPPEPDLGASQPLRTSRKRSLNKSSESTSHALRNV
ncbi:hypothetical protein BKA70DRAFT_1446470 [Coprinopsis sp. MPI-PUGE-AT-0042]|nr:hypothetical protein BKA70DRAFT_1446470 [Coprinopsis sp. MPI-PUGE-AT-0042]